MKRVVVGISGGSGPIMAVRLLEALRQRADVETHLIASPAAIRTLALENPEFTWAAVKDLAHHVYDHKDIAAAPASGSFLMHGMVVIPASMNTAAAMAYGLNDNLLVRTADVFLKERRNLIVVPRETPLHEGHLETLARLAKLGACILPPVIAFYHAPKTVDDIVAHTVGKVMDQLGLDHDLFQRWGGPPSRAP